MHISRHGQGVRAATTAFASQVHPVFMLPPLAAAWFGAALAGQFSITVAAVHATALFFAVYTAHVKDGLVDFHVRGEDDDHPLTETGCWIGLAAATTGFAACLAGLWLLVDATSDIGAAFGTTILTLPTWLIAYHHAPQLDMHPVTATCGYPAGIALAMLGGFHAQTGGLAPAVGGFAAIFFVLLSGVKVIDDATDYDYDRSIQKRTVAVVLGPRRARAFAHLLLATATFGVVALAVTAFFPLSTVIAAIAFALVALVARRADPELATMLLIRGAYVFLAVLFAAVWFRPLG